MRTHKLSQVQSIAIVMMMSFEDSRMKLKSFVEELNAPARDKPKCDAIANNTPIKQSQRAIRDMIVRKDNNINE